MFVNLSKVLYKTWIENTMTFEPDENLCTSVYPWAHVGNGTSYLYLEIEPSDSET